MVYDSKRYEVDLERRVTGVHFNRYNSGGRGCALKDRIFEGSKSQSKVVRRYGRAVCVKHGGWHVRVFLCLLFDAYPKLFHQITRFFHSVRIISRQLLKYSHCVVILALFDQDQSTIEISFALNYRVVALNIQH